MTLNQWYIVALGAGAGTFVLRAAPFLLAGRYPLGDRALKFLIYTAMSFFAGVISKSLLMWRGEFDAVELSIKLTALVMALALYARFKNVLLSLFTGVFLAVALKYLFG